MERRDAIRIMALGTLGLAIYGPHLLDGCRATDQPRMLSQVIASDRCVVGAFVGDSSSPHYSNFISNFVDQSRQNPSMIKIFQAWGQDFEPLSKSGILPFPERACSQISAQGCSPLIAWEPYRFSRDVQNVSVLDIINNDRLNRQFGIDQSVAQWAQQASRFNGEIFLAFAPAPNRNIFPWSGAVNGDGRDANSNGIPDGAENYIAAWRRIKGIFEHEKATNVRFVFSVNASSTPEASWNDIWDYYPGDEYVDWIGLQGMNSEAEWKTFGQIFRPAYDSVVRMNRGNKPIMITETACQEPDDAERASGASKEAWIRDFASTLRTRMPLVRAAVWFNTGNYSVDSSRSSLAQFRTSIAGNDYFSPSTGTKARTREVDPRSPADIAQEQIAREDVIIQESMARRGVAIREHHMDPTYDLKEAQAILRKAVLTPGSPIPCLQIEEVINRIPKQVRQYGIFPVEVAGYYEGRLLLVQAYSLAGNKVRAVDLLSELIADKDADEGYKMKARLIRADIQKKEGTATPTELEAEYGSVLEFADKIKDPYLQAMATLGRADVIIKTQGYTQGVVDDIERIIAWQDLQRPGLLEKCWIFGVWATQMDQAQPYWISDWNTMMNTGSLFVEEHVWNTEPRALALTMLGESLGASGDRDKRLTAIAILTEASTMRNAPVERASAAIQRIQAQLKGF